MTPDRWSEIERLYHLARQRPPHQRAAFLDTACGGDEEIHSEVDSLLNYIAGDAEFLHAAMIEVADQARYLSGGRQDIGEFGAGELGRVESVESGTHPREVPRMEGRELRGYKIDRKIGQGGMGSVYLAERADGAYRKQVAIKLVSFEKCTAELLERFRRERNILASLDHPNIARLIDGGATEEGMPYFVMEFVDGRSIHRWCDEVDLNIEQRLRLFLKVCSAVQYAHQRLVAHRDLKPGNILVTDDGTVKLLDFGIAKLIDDKRSTEVPETLPVMTPDYASPEQVKGEAITTLSDVYSLGVVLYELLTAQRPYNLAGVALHEAMRVICEEQPLRPSDMVTTSQVPRESQPGEEPVAPEADGRVPEGNRGRLYKRLRGDLDTIVLTALRKEPARRYGSVEALSEDLRRHLECLPITAREDSPWYRVSRFAMRNPGAIIAGAVIGLLMVAVVWTSMWRMRLVAGTEHALLVRGLLAPEILLLLSFILAGLLVISYVARARPKRVIGALAGGMLVAIDAGIKLRLDYALGWWRGRFAEDQNPLDVFSHPPIFLILIFGSAAYLLIMWRVSRRFGRTGLAILIVCAGVHLTLKERLWWDISISVTTMSFGPYSLAFDGALWIMGFVAGYATMRLIAGRARADGLARKPLTLKSIPRA
jgi:eukaryotic-like serine/threonine-protein kinase